ncbi:MAG TPA: BON domain-containing protein [Pyrinomonadaceae bacterium]|nr:BON domain-containing protein [Pyrinomonadaceae bacterium]
MNKRTFLAIFACAALGLALAACGDSGNTNVNVNANSANTNANANMNTNMNANANTATGSVYNRNYNSKDDFRKDDTNYRGEAKNAGAAIGSGIEDGWIHFKVRGALALVDDLRDSTINVDVDNNVVTLRGSVANAAQKAKAEAEAKKIDGVKSVTNKLEIKAADAPVGSTNSNKTD